MNEKNLLYLALFIGAASLIYIASNNGEIQNYLGYFEYQSVRFQNQAQLYNSSLPKPDLNSETAPSHLIIYSSQSRCEYLLGILTIPKHKSMRNFIRKSWVNDLPTNVCYVFLFDQAEYIPKNESFDSISINASYEGFGVRFGEKLYRYFSYVINDPNLENVKYIVKMDDDAVLCPVQLFEYLHNKKITPKSYVGWFHNMGSWKSKVDYDHRSDEMFVLLGRELVARIASKTYCEQETKKYCDSLGQLFDTNYGGTSLGIWLSTMNDIDPLPINDVFDHFDANTRLKPEHTLLFHTAKTPEIAEEKYSNCQKIRLYQTLFS